MSTTRDSTPFKARSPRSALYKGLKEKKKGNSENLKRECCENCVRVSQELFKSVAKKSSEVAQKDREKISKYRNKML
jgi:hypothetical protein